MVLLRNAKYTFIAVCIALVLNIGIGINTLRVFQGVESNSDIVLFDNLGLSRVIFSNEDSFVLEGYDTVSKKDVKVTAFTSRGYGNWYDSSEGVYLCSLDGSSFTRLLMPYGVSAVVFLVAVMFHCFNLNRGNFRLFLVPMVSFIILGSYLAYYCISVYRGGF